MKRVSAKLKISQAANIIAFVFNAALLLSDSPGDLGDWVLKIVEFIVFLDILIVSWRWRILPMLLKYIPKPTTS